jgi:hypothetical protein
LVPLWMILSGVTTVECILEPFFFQISSQVMDSLLQTRHGMVNLMSLLTRSFLGPCMANRLNHTGTFGDTGSDMPSWVEVDVCERR